MGSVRRDKIGVGKHVWVGVILRDWMSIIHRHMRDGGVGNRLKGIRNVIQRVIR